MCTEEPRQIGGYRAPRVASIQAEISNAHYIVSPGSFFHLTRDIAWVGGDGAIAGAGPGSAPCYL